MNLHYQIRHGLLLSAITGLSNSGEVVLPSAGIYYAVPIGCGWQVMAYRYADVEEEIDHSRFWERHVAKRLAGHWATKVAQSFNNLTKLLKEHPYGFPRGRVGSIHNAYHIYHGSDLSKSMGIKRQTIEIIFGIKGKTKWIEDDHEHCLEADKQAVREALVLEEDWESV